MGLKTWAKSKLGKLGKSSVKSKADEAAASLERVRFYALNPRVCVGGVDSTTRLKPPKELWCPTLVSRISEQVSSRKVAVSFEPIYLSNLCDETRNYDAIEVVFNYCGRVHSLSPRQHVVRSIVGVDRKAV